MQAKKALVNNIQANSSNFEHIRVTIVLLEHNLANIVIVEHFFITNILRWNIAWTKKYW